MNQFERASVICEYLKGKMDFIPDVAIVLGSGLGSFVNQITEKTEILYKDIPMFPVATVKGHEGKMITGKVSGKKVVAMQGRFHLYEGYSTDDVIIHVRVFKLLGVKSLIVTNAAGAVNKEFNAGDLMVIRDHIGLFCPSPLFGSNDERFGTRFPSMTTVYDDDYFKIALNTAAEIGLSVRSGVYCYCKGPMFETPAEICAIRTFGADAAGMSTVPEVIAAVHSGIRVLGISCLTNMAAGILNVPLTHDEVMETGKRVEKDFSRFIGEIIGKI